MPGVKVFFIYPRRNPVPIGELRKAVGVNTMNRIKTTLLLSILTVLMVFMGSALGGTTGMVRQLALKAELPMPRVYIIHPESPNALATGLGPHVHRKPVDRRCSHVTIFDTPSHGGADLTTGGHEQRVVRIQQKKLGVSA
jgi:hypothetical protein